MGTAKGIKIEGHDTNLEDTAMLTMIRNFAKDEEGASAVEYGLLAALIAAVIVGVVTTLGTQLQGTFQTISDALPGAGG